MTTHRVAPHRADVVMSAQHRAGKTFQDDAESAGRDVEVTGLKPDARGIGNPALVIFEFNVGDEMVPTSLSGFQSVGEAAEGGDRHVFPRVDNEWPQLIRE